MPTDEQGDKWACEPCIRGHRSTKCEHWDRFMLRVKKPGRPLSSCPHPKNQCNCGKERVMMVRIPKASSCICAPAYSLGPDGHPIHTEVDQQYYGSFSPPPFSYQTPPLSSDSYRVQKATRRTSGVMDPHTVARAFEANKRYLNGAHGASSPPLRSPEDSRIDVCGNSFGGAHTGPRGQGLKEDESSNRKTNFDGFHNEAHNNLTPRSVTLKPQYASNRSPKATCCQPKSVSPAEHPTIDAPAQTSVGEEINRANATGMSAGELWQGDVPRTTMYTIPSSYATASHPLHPEQLAQFQHDTQRFSQSVPYYASSGIIGSAAPSADSIRAFNPAHNCSCGENCSCKFCAVHPYNATTLHSVQDLGRILEESFSQSPSQPEDSYGSPIDVVDGHGLFQGATSMFLGNTSSSAANTSFEPASQQLTPSSEHETFTTSQDSHLIYSSSSYYTMEYPMQGEVPFLSCTNIGGSYICSDCTCVGCLTHCGHDGSFLLDPSSTEALHQSFPDSVPEHKAPDAAPAPVNPNSFSKCC